MKVFILLGTLDTKGREVEYIARRAQSLGIAPIVIDVGLLGTPQYPADISRQDVAAAANTTIDALMKLGDKTRAIDTMIQGATARIRDLIARNKADGILALGGAQGTYIGAEVMQALPFGFPKVIVSAIANGNTRFGPVTGTKDITVIHSVADILGLNYITRTVLDEGLNALVGMIQYGARTGERAKKTVALTAAGVTTAAAMLILDYLEKLDYEVITFHCNGIAAKAMEELALENQLDAILDLSPHNITDLVAGGIMPAETDRLDFLSRIDIPYVIAPGCTDLVLGAEVNTLPPGWLNRKHYQHNPFHTHVRATYEEMYKVGAFIGEHLEEALGKAAVVVPMKGFSQANIEGGAIYDPKADKGFLDGLRANLAKSPAEKIGVFEIDHHINTAEFSKSIARIMDSLIRSGSFGTEGENLL